jgi:Integrase core domain.
MLIPIRNASSEEIIENLLNQYIYLFGTPRNVLTDQGSNFISELVQQFEHLFKIEHIKTTVWHPQRNGNIEIMHSTIKNLIKSATEDN